MTIWSYNGVPVNVIDAPLSSRSVVVECATTGKLLRVARENLKEGTMQ